MLLFELKLFLTVNLQRLELYSLVRSKARYVAYVEHQQLFRGSLLLLNKPERHRTVLVELLVSLSIVKFS